MAERKSLINDTFGDVRFIELDDAPDEFGFVTGPASEKTFYEKIKNIPDVLSSIRLEGRM